MQKLEKTPSQKNLLVYAQKSSLSDKQAQYIADKLNAFKDLEAFEKLFQQFVFIVSNPDGEINLYDLGCVLAKVRDEEKHEICLKILRKKLFPEEIHELARSTLYFELAKEKNQGKAPNIREDSMVTKFFIYQRQLEFSHTHVFASVFVEPSIMRALKIVESNHATFSKYDWPEKICDKLVEVLNEYLNIIFTTQTLQSIPFSIIRNAKIIWQYPAELEQDADKRLSLLGNYILRAINPIVQDIIKFRKKKYKIDYQAIFTKIFMLPILRLVNHIGPELIFLNKYENKGNQIWEKVLYEKFYSKENMGKIKKYLETMNELEVSEEKENVNVRRERPHELHDHEPDLEEARQIIIQARKVEDLAIENNSKTNFKEKEEETESHFMEEKKKHKKSKKDSEKEKLTNSQRPHTNSKSDETKKTRKKKSSQGSQMGSIVKDKPCPVPPVNISRSQNSVSSMKNKKSNEKKKSKNFTPPTLSSARSLPTLPTFSSFFRFNSSSSSVPESPLTTRERSRSIATESDSPESNHPEVVKSSSYEKPSIFARRKHTPKKTKSPKSTPKMFAGMLEQDLKQGQRQKEKQEQGQRQEQAKPLPISPKQGGGDK